MHICLSCKATTIGRMQKMHKDHSNMRVLKLLNSFCPAYFPYLVVRSFFVKLSPYFNLYLSAEILNEIVGSKDKNRLITLAIIIVFGNFFITIIGGILNRIVGHKEMLLYKNEAIYFNRKTLSLDYEDFENTEVRQLRRNITESAKINCHGKQLLLVSIGRLIDTTISALLSLVLGVEMFVLIFASGFDWHIILFTGLIICVITFNIRYTFKIKDKMGVLSQKVSQSLIDENRIDDAIDCYNMGKDIRLYRQDKLIVKIETYILNLHKKAYRDMANKSYVANIPLTVAEIVLMAVIYMFVSAYTSFGLLAIGSLIKYVGIVESMMECITNYFNVFADIKYNTPFINNYLAYFDIPQKMHQGTLSVENQNFSNYTFEFKNVSFKYPGTDTYALHHVNIKIESGDRLAIVGMNGSGKTTFVKLMCRLYDPTEGEILFNNVNIKKYNYDEYLSLFSMVFQDFKLFAFSLGENVASRADYDDKKVISALQRSGFEERLSTMTEGIKTYLYKDFDINGAEISGGEAQKIAIARALYKNAPVFILDEPTAALDPIAEYEIYTKFNNIIENKTTIYISHRLSSCRFCDKIAVFDQGAIVQSGNHSELLAYTNGKYKELWDAQSQYYTANDKAKQTNNTAI